MVLVLVLLEGAGRWVGQWGVEERGQNGRRGRGYSRGHGRENSRGGWGGRARLSVGAV